MLLDLFSVEYSQLYTHDGGYRKKHHEDDDGLKRRNLELRKQEEEKLDQAKRLRSQIEKAAYGEVLAIKEPKITKYAEKPAKVYKQEKDHIPAYEATLHALNLELELLTEQIRLNEIEQKRRREDDDIQVILLTIH